MSVLLLRMILSEVALLHGHKHVDGEAMVTADVGREVIVTADAGRVVIERAVVVC